MTKMGPIKRGDVKLPPHLMEMERNGLIRIGTGKIKKSFWTLPRPADQKARPAKHCLRKGKNRDDVLGRLGGKRTIPTV